MEGRSRLGRCGLCDGREGGLGFYSGALDFAGGTVVHINAGIAALVGALLIGPRIGYRKEIMAPHSMTLTMVGAWMLWVGWFGFNAGSALAAGGGAALAMMNTFIATAGATSPGARSRRCSRGKASMLGVASGMVAGLVAVTPAAGFSGRWARSSLGVDRWLRLLLLRAGGEEALGYDDSLDVFGVHGIGGIVGALGTGILVNPDLGGTGILDYAAGEGVVAASALSSQMISQLEAVGSTTLVWSGGHRPGPLPARRSRRSAWLPTRHEKVSTSPTPADAPTTCRLS